MAVQMQYGQYNFTPVPLIDIQKNFNYQQDGVIIGSYFTTTLNGTLIPGTGGLASIMQQQDLLRTAFAQQGQLFTITCSDAVLLSAYPRIIQNVNYPKSADNWTVRSDYTIVLQYDEEPTVYYSGDAILSGYENSGLAPPFISELSESWQCEVVEDYARFNINLGGSFDTNPFQFRLTHTLGAVGKLEYNSSGVTMEPWQQAQNYIVPLLGFALPFLQASGVLNIGSGTPYNYVRANNVGHKEGRYDVTESWLVLSEGAPCVESYTVDFKKSIQSDISTISIQGTCQGLEVRNYGTSPGDFSVTSNKFDNATSYFNSINGTSLIYPRCVYFASTIPTSRTLNPTPASQSIAYSPSQGFISYNFEYNDRPLNCIAGALTESITIFGDNTIDVFASIPIIGRTAGPVLQSMNTVTSPTRGITVEVIVPPSVGCTTADLFSTNPRAAVANLINLFYTDLLANSQVFRTQDTENWEPKIGHYTRTVAWVYSNSCV